ncbi:hypothetical protein BDZ45DRAFT_495301 [Acephala macrosclerotiorum]|nr:hypothetical protein BDZ45DRAFT_495301 [Acephala macrosclerotiorum]
MDLPDEVALAKFHRLRMLLAELGAFIRGCEISTITWHLPLLSGTVEMQRGAKFESLLKWNNTCAYCRGKLSLPSGKLPRAVFRVGMKDVRTGDYITRSQIPHNRGDIYDCFSAFTADIGQKQLSWETAEVPFTFISATCTILGVSRAEGGRHYLHSLIVMSP